MTSNLSGTLAVPPTTTPHYDTTLNSVHVGRFLPGSVLLAWSEMVSPAAHALAHPSPVFGCPGCPDGGVSRDMSAETSWRELAA